MLHPSTTAGSAAAPGLGIRLACWLETALIQTLLTLVLWPLKLIYNRPMEPWWVWDTNRKLCNLDQRFC